MAHSHLVNGEVDVARPVARQQSLGNEGVEQPLDGGNGVVGVDESAAVQGEADARARRTACLASSLARLIADQWRR